jgi:hypothetical protein
MSLEEAITFVLWSERFDEASAAIFVTQLRQCGCRVKLVGIGGMSSKGIHGLVLTPDLMLDQALPLASRAKCVIFPCSTVGLRRLKNDPRVTEFLQRAERNHARFFTGSTRDFNAHKDDSAVRPAGPLPLGVQISLYPDGEQLVGFVRELARSLASQKRTQ